MFDLNKEREAFLNTFQYYKGRRDIIFSNEHELFMTRSNNPSEIAQEEISNINSRWDAWLRCAKHRDAELEKAKAQAVPEGYCLVPKEIPDSVVSCLENSRFHWGYGTRDYYTPIYSLMVEAASESGAEG
ncbi:MULTISPECIES: hypothetical protein [Acinetobacter]|uniref:hypothetical protein n=1 Tax=Acinetobacter TaxID=469 RepID=UPI00035DA0D0|nr:MULTISPECIES: hypothetical protein [Acinetobacter]KCX58039.1 hypothetical protein J541_3945 [Acinetobacter pittii]KCX58438.1 hypothetical protein J541_3909 [Acinetobacter pittii]MBJ8449515.1 hypothetical protein [Acinetobacter pittii]MCG5256943.1 hypothetical protein [Acinetobacter pittii]MCK0869051.1 hypothetical protein [Acinetobacter pittii]